MVLSWLSSTYLKPSEAREIVSTVAMTLVEIGPGFNP